MGQAEEDNVEIVQSLVEDSLVQENLVKEVADSTVSAGESSNSQPDKKKLKKQNTKSSK